MENLILTTGQQKVLDEVKEFISGDAPVFILRGYAGTGKTTMIRLIADYISETREVALMAPTGRAARVLEKKTGRRAFTIHKSIYSKAALETKEEKDIADTTYKLHFPIAPTNGKVVAIVDESSMLSSKDDKEQLLFRFGSGNLMDDLLAFVYPIWGGKVIFVGDPAQLPPVGENISQALNGEFFRNMGVQVKEVELTEVLRQTGDSIILKNAMQIRNLLGEERRNHLVFEEKNDDVVSLPSEKLLEVYFKNRSDNIAENDSVVICYSNSSASRYNKDIRKILYGEECHKLNVGDVLMVAQNNYMLNKMNGEFVVVSFVGDTLQQSAPVYVQKGGRKERVNITMTLQHVKVTDSEGEQQECMLSLDLLNNEYASLSYDEQRALFINFCMRHPNLKLGSESFSETLQVDPYFNCLRAKYGYAVTGHKCQGGEWKKVYVDYSGRTGLSDDCLRWAYTATTRAQQVLYFTNLPHITPFSRFRIEPVQQCAKVNEECRVLGQVGKSPYHDSSQPDYLHAKCLCIMGNMRWTPYSIVSVVSKPYQEIYTVSTPDGVERYDIRYKKGGVFMKAEPQKVSKHSVLMGMILNDEQAIPIVFDYRPSSETHEKLYNMIRSACDELTIPITNVVEHNEDYSVVYYLRTSGSVSYIKVYINGDGFVTYAKPMSLIGTEDAELKVLIEVIQNHFE